LLGGRVLEVSAVDFAEGPLPQELVLRVVVCDRALPDLPLQVFDPASVVLLIVDIEDALKLLGQLKFYAPKYFAGNFFIRGRGAVIDDEEAADEGVHEFDILLALGVVAVDISALQGHVVVLNLVGPKFEIDLALVDILFLFL